MEPEHYEGRGEYFLPPCVPLTLILSLLVFSSSPLYATTALLPRSLKRQLWLSGPFHDAIFFWGGRVLILYLHLALRVGMGLLVTRPQVKPSLGPC